MVKCDLVSGRGMGFRPGRNFHNHSSAQVVAVCDMDPMYLLKNRFVVWKVNIG